jgi:hypothetical protein
MTKSGGTAAKHLEAFQHSTVSCPLWVTSGHMQCKRACPLYLWKRTLAAVSRMSAKGQKLKLLTEQIMSAFPSSADTGGEESGRLLCAKSGSRDLIR